MKKLILLYQSIYLRFKIVDSHNKIADDLIAAERPVIVLGEHVNSNSSSSDIANIISGNCFACKCKDCQIKPNW